MLNLFLSSAKSAGTNITNDLGCSLFNPITDSTKYSLSKDQEVCLYGFGPNLIFNDKVKISVQFYDNETQKYRDVISKSSFIGVGISYEDMYYNNLHPYLIKLTGKKDGAYAISYSVSAPASSNTRDTNIYYTTRGGKRTLKSYINVTYAKSMEVKVFSNKVDVEWKNNNRTIYVDGASTSITSSTEASGKQSNLINPEITGSAFDTKLETEKFGKVDVSWSCDKTYTRISGTVPDKTKILTKSDFGFPIWAIIVIVVVLVLLILLLVFWIMVWCRCMLILAICPGYACCRPII